MHRLRGALQAHGARAWGSDQTQKKVLPSDANGSDTQTSENNPGLSPAFRKHFAMHGSDFLGPLQCYFSKNRTTVCGSGSTKLCVHARSRESRAKVHWPASDDAAALKEMTSGTRASWEIVCSCTAACSHMRHFAHALKDPLQVITSLRTQQPATVKRARAVFQFLPHTAAR